MDFFQQQDVARRNTWWLILLFALAVVVIVLAVYLVAALALSMTSDETGRDTMSNRLAEDPFNLELFIWVALGTLAVIVLGSLYKMSELAHGGETVALMLGGRLITSQSRDLAEKRLLNVVEEMALASGVPVPPVYVMDNEASINAFAAGNNLSDAVIGVSRGSLNYLTRDELQGVMAHEFSHMINGDMRINLRLIGLLHGILILAILGWFAIRSAGFSSATSRRSNGGGGGVAMMIAIGVGLLVIGSIGLLFGKLIKAAVSRQREYLADAAAVQFTRYPQGIAGALKKIGGRKESSRIEDAHAEEVSHLFFGNAFGGITASLLSTHPPLVKRIQRIEPGFNGDFPRVKPVAATEPKRKKRRQKKSALGGVLGGKAGPSPLDPTGVFGQVLPGGMGQLIYAGAVLADMPEQLSAAAHEPYAARAVIYALLLDRDPEMRRSQMAMLEKRAESLSFQETQRLAAELDKLPRRARLPLAEVVLPTLKQLSPDQYTAFHDNVEALVDADQKMDLFEYAIYKLVLRNLDIYFGRRKAPSVRFHSLKPMIGPIRTLLSLVAYSGGQSKQQTEHAFNLGIAAVGQGASLRSLKECTFAKLDEALEQLAQAAPKIQQRVVAGCAACIAADKKVTDEEAELLRVVAGMLGCPLPPMVPTEPAASGT